MATVAGQTCRACGGSVLQLDHDPKDGIRCLQCGRVPERRDLTNGHRAGTAFPTARRAV